MTETALLRLLRGLDPAPRCGTLCGAMPRRARIEKRLLAAQDTVGMQRAERQEQRDLADRKLVEAARVKALRTRGEREDAERHAPRRVARPGKPLKR
jgi:hypothetical protein